MKYKKIFIDLDGVIVNWLRGGCELMNIPLPPEENIEYNWLYSQCPKEKIVEKLENNETFWVELRKFYWSDLLIEQLETHFPNQWRFLTKATANTSSYTGKAKWIKKHYPDYLNKLIICSDCKSFFACNNAILIDDNPDGINKFNEAGGHGFLWTEVNEKYAIKQINEKIQNLISFIKKIK